MSSRLRRLVPYLIAVTALLFVISRIDLHLLHQAVARAPLGQLVALSAVMTLLNCAADTLAMFYVFRWFGLRLRFVDLYTIRAATYLLAVINYHAGQLGIIGFLHRASGVPIFRASGYVLFIVGVWVGLLLLLASFGAFLGGPQGAALLPVLALFAVGMVVYVALLLLQPRLLREPPATSGLLHMLGIDEAPQGRWQRLLLRVVNVAVSLLQPLLAAGLWGHVRALFVRLPHLMVLVVWHYLALRAFGVAVPFGVAAIFLPVVFAVASLPISPQGLGTAQIAAVFFFQGYAPVGSGREAVLAYSLSMTTISVIGSLTMGLLFLGRGARLGLKTTVEDDVLEAEPAAQRQAASEAT